MAIFTDIFEDVTKYATKIPTNEYLESGKYPIIDQGQNYIAGYTNSINGLFTDVPAIIFGDHTRVIKYVDHPCFLGADGVKLLKSHKVDNHKYLYYALLNVNIPNTGYNRHFKWLKEVNVPIPNAKTQENIVCVLDKVTTLISLRRKQLEKLDELVKSRFIEMFGDPATNPMRWTESTIGAECYYIKDGPHKSLTDIGKENGGHPFISVRNIVNGFIDFSTAKYISDDDFYEAIKKCHPEKGDMLYSKGGTTGIAKLIDIDETFANWVHVAVLKFNKDRINGIFFENLLNSSYCFNQSQKLTKGIANRDLVLSAMSQIKIICPPLDLQNQFAEFVKQTDKSKVAVQISITKCHYLTKKGVNTHA